MGFKAGGNENELKENEIEMESQAIFQNQVVKIFKGKYKDQNVAVKEIGTSIPLRDQRKMKQEAKTLLQLQHPNIIKFYGILPKRCAIVTEYLEKCVIVDDDEVWVNDVRGLLDCAENNLDWATSLQIARDSGNALQFLHGRGVIHSDVKAGNFFLGGGSSSEYIVKLGDFGESIRECKMRTLTTTFFQMSGNKKEDERKIAGTIPFIAPQLFQMGAKPSVKSDIYSFSMYLIELLVPTRSHPWSDDVFSPDMISSFLREEKRPTLPEATMEESKTFIQVKRETWKSNPEDRVDLETIKTLFGKCYENRESQIEKAVGDQFNFKKWQHTDGDVQISVLHLNCHQGSSVDIAGEISSSFWNAGEDVPPELSKEIEQAANKFDGTNACQFFSSSFATLLVGNKPSVLQSLEGRARMKDSIESMIVTIAHKINDVRDKRQHVFLEDALSVLTDLGFFRHHFIYKNRLVTSYKAVLRAVVSKYRLRYVKYEKSKSLKIFQNKGLWEVFKEK